MSHSIPSPTPDPQPNGFTVLVVDSEDSQPRIVSRYSTLAAAMEHAGVRWYETNGGRPYDVWVRCEATGRLHFAPGLRIRLEHGAHDPETLRLGELLERAPLP